jgi:membrane-bound lytic murein transglycosylase B
VARRLKPAIDRWLAGGEAELRGGASEEVELLALRQQRLTLLLAERRRLFRTVLPRLAPALRSRVRDDVLARRELTGIHSVVVQRPRIRVARPRPAAELRAHYRRAWRRFGVGPPLLAAVNLVESQFGRLRNESVSGARGPMQFMPATWSAYGLGGNVRDPRDAILGAANYLHANGAPREEGRALFHYNPSRLYVSAVRRYARQMRRDPNAFYSYYAWQVFVRTKTGLRRMSGPGLE